MFGKRNKPSFTVLLVEDAPQDTEIIERVLRKYKRADFQVEVVSSVAECRNVLAERTFEVLLLDQNLPGESGLDLLVGTATKTKLPPTIMLTGQTDALIAKEAIIHGAYDYVSKDNITGHLLPDTIMDVIARAHADATDREAQIEAANLAFIDPLTTLYNRRYLSDAIQKECNRANRYGSAIACLMIDLDNFKEINESYGHPEADSVLTQLAGFIRTTVRDADIVARYGGDEFCVLLPETSAEGAHLLAERLRSGIASMNLVVGGEAIRISASVGMFSPPTAQPIRPESLIDHADEALRRAKVAGKNTVRVYGRPGTPATGMAR
ncbi:MAG: GGDEF domain-containing response regulator [Chloroflexi bacterium]|nr:GGDEF domain-containing response regulator [Chloroflexota bacterium]